MADLSEGRIKQRYDVLGEQLADAGIDIDGVKEKVKAFEVEVPSWVFGVFGGGRFGDYMPPGPARDRFSKIKDAGLVHKLTGAAPRVAIHPGWDCPADVAFDDIQTEQFADLKDCALENGIDIGAVNPTYFLKGTHHGSLGSPLPGVRESMIRHSLVSCEIAEKYAQGLVTYWLTDGSNYPGERDLWRQEALVRDAPKQTEDGAADGIIHLIEYRRFEPGTYSTVIVDWGTAMDMADGRGDRAGVLVDLGHHAHGVNIQQIVARLIGTGRRGGFHFNTRYAADDDHAVEPNIEMYAVFGELVQGGVVCAADAAANWPLMIDQCSSLENRIRAVLHSIDSLMVSLAKALVLDVKALEAARAGQDLIPANRVFLDAFLTDVRPILYAARLEKGLPPDPLTAYDESGYQQQIEAARGG